jgi:hypothetical protein
VAQPSSPFSARNLVVLALVIGAAAVLLSPGLRSSLLARLGGSSSGPVFVMLDRTSSDDTGKGHAGVTVMNESGAAIERVTIRCAAFQKGKLIGENSDTVSLPAPLPPGGRHAHEMEVDLGGHTMDEMNCEVTGAR